MKIQANIKGHICQIFCNQGLNSIQWLADCAVIWLQTMTGMKINQTPVKVTKLNGQQLFMTSLVKDLLLDGDSVFVYLQEDVEFMNMGR